MASRSGNGRTTPSGDRAGDGTRQVANQPGRDSRDATAPTASDVNQADSGRGLRVLFHVNHPAQVHLFRHPIAQLRAAGHETLVTSRDKEVTLDLLEAFDLDHRPLTVRGESVPELLWELCKREVRLLSVAREFEPDVMVSRLSPATAHVSAVVGAPYVVFSDTRIDDATMRRLYQAVTFPFVDRVCAPASFDLPVDGERREVLDFQELSYLHPRYFEPDPVALREHGVDPDEHYAVIRTAAWDAYHDLGHAGISPQTLRDLVEVFSSRGTVYVSAEGSLPRDLSARRLQTPPELVHDVLYYADCYVGDSGTMSSEAAILGTPAVRTNSMVGADDEDIFHALADDYGLLQSYRDEQQALAAVERIVDSAGDRDVWREKRDRLVGDQPDVTAAMVQTILETARENGDGHDD